MASPLAKTSSATPDEPVPAGVVPYITPRALMQQALAQGGDPVAMAAVIKELVALEQSMQRFEWEKEERQSKIEFDDALSLCQKEIEQIKPNVKRADTNSWWADYRRLDEVVRPIYTAKGFNITYTEVASLKPGKVRIEGTLSRKGISIVKGAEITPSTTGPKGGAMATATDADAIALARAKRYILIDIFNISVAIDQTEKLAISQPGAAMGQSSYLDHLNAIKGAHNVEDLEKSYIDARTAAEKAKDEPAKGTFYSAKNARYRELAKKVTDAKKAVRK